MKKLVISILLPLFLLNGTIEQWIKLPVFFKHFSEHKTTDPSLSLVDFISMHYFGDDRNNADNDRDNELPFKKTGDPISFNVEASLFVAELKIDNAEYGLRKVYSDHYQHNTTCDSNYKEPRPPRVS